MRRRTGVEIGVDSLFDVQVKRIHEYKRQLLNLIHVVTRYIRILEEPRERVVPRTVIFGGKAAPGYAMAKSVIRLINNVARTINGDEPRRGKLQVVFLPNYDVSLAQKIMPAADLSQQISTAGMEASGTGNMKLALSGALTIGTLDGANIEIRDHVGAENIFIFGMTADEAAAKRAAGYQPWRELEGNPALGAALDLIESGIFPRRVWPTPRRWSGGSRARGSPSSYWPILPPMRPLRRRVDEMYDTPDEWSRKAVLNCLNMGYFSSDRAVREYADRIWNVRPVI